jgi:hypothetical protein
MQSRLLEAEIATFITQIENRGIGDIQIDVTDLPGVARDPTGENKLLFRAIPREKACVRTEVDASKTRTRSKELRITLSRRRWRVRSHHLTTTGHPRAFNRIRRELDLVLSRRSHGGCR